jgi:hypothetical protein
MDLHDPARETAPAVCWALIFIMKERAMARTTNQPSTATRRNTAKTRADTNERGSFDEQDQRGEDNQLGDNDERRENLNAVRHEQDEERNNSRDDRDERDERDERGNFNGREFGECRDRDERRDSGEYAEQDSRREQGPALTPGLDSFAPVLEAWKQVFKSWSELTETMVKVQQDAFASMISGANAHAKDLNLGDNRNSERAFSSGSRATAATPERIDRDRR